MSRKDTITKDYMKDNTIFADAVNCVVFHGEQRIKPEDLHCLDSNETVLVYGKNSRDLTVQKLRDVIKYWKKEDLAYLILGIENQSAIDYAMPVRNFLYDAMLYASQVEQTAKEHKKEIAATAEKQKVTFLEKISENTKTENEEDGFDSSDNPKHKNAVTKAEFLSGFHKTDKLTPLITLVIYFGAEIWDGPRTLHDMFSDFSPELREFLPDYKLNLLIPAEMSDAEIQQFHSGLREIFLFLKYSNDKKAMAKLLSDHTVFQNLDYQTAKLINAVSGTRIKFKKKEEALDMCKAFDDMWLDGKNTGENIGKEIGKWNTLIGQVIKKLKRNYSVSMIADMLEEKETTIQFIMSSIQKYAPDYPEDLILADVLASAEKIS